MVISIQINQKNVAEQEVVQHHSESDVRELLKFNNDFQSALDNRIIKNFLYIPGKIVNVIV